MKYAYNAFGERVRSTDAENRVVDFGYDRLGNLLWTEKGSVAVFTVDGTVNPVQTRYGKIRETWTYDQLGRQRTQTNGNGERLSYTYDLRGNVVETWQPMGQVARSAFDALGRKIVEADANNRRSTWSYDYFGHLKGPTWAASRLSDAYTIAERLQLGCRSTFAALKL